MNKELFSTGRLSAAAEVEHILNLVASQYGGGGGVTKHIKLRGSSAYNQQIRDSCKKENSYIYTYAAERHFFSSYCTAPSRLSTFLSAQRRSNLCRIGKKSAAGQTFDWCVLTKYTQVSVSSWL